MEEKFKGEAIIIEKLKSAAKKAQEKYSKAHDELTAIDKSLAGFDLTIDFQTGEITKA